jgi:hypothetical protein
MLVAVLFWLVCGAIGATIAPTRGLSPGVGTGIGVMLGPLGLLVLCLLPQGRYVPPGVSSRYVPKAAPRGPFYDWEVGLCKGCNRTTQVRKWKPTNLLKKCVDCWYM